MQEDISKHIINKELVFRICKSILDLDKTYNQRSGKIR
jgi:hypothetical protein